jgi:hypothetical protein
VDAKLTASAMSDDTGVGPNRISRASSSFSTRQILNGPVGPPAARRRDREQPDAQGRCLDSLGAETAPARWGICDAL